LILLSW